MVTIDPATFPPCYLKRCLFRKTSSPPTTLSSKRTPAPCTPVVAIPLPQLCPSPQHACDESVNSVDVNHPPLNLLTNPLRHCLCRPQEGTPDSPHRWEEDWWPMGGAWAGRVPVGLLGHGTALLKGLPRPDPELPNLARGSLMSRLCADAQLRRRPPARTRVAGCCRLAPSWLPHRFWGLGLVGIGPSLPELSSSRGPGVQPYASGALAKVWPWVDIVV